MKLFYEKSPLCEETPYTKGDCMDWSAFGFADNTLTQELMSRALFDVESGLDYSAACGQFIRMNLSSTRQQIESAMDRLSGALNASKA